MQVKYSRLNILFLVIVFAFFLNFSGSSKNQSTVGFSMSFSDSIYNETNVDILATNVHDTIIIDGQTHVDSIFSTNPDSNKLIMASELHSKVEKPKEPLSDTIFDFNLSTEIHYRIILQFRTIEGKENFIKGWEKNIELENLTREINELRDEYSKSISSSSKERIAAKVIELEQKQIGFKEEKDNFFLTSRNAEYSFWETANEDDIFKLKTQNDSISEAEILKLQPKPQPVIEPVIDTTSIEATDSTIVLPQENEPINQQNTNKVVYKVQIGSYNTKLPAYVEKLYKKLSVLRKIDNYIDDKGITVYTIGEVTSLPDAAKLQNQIRQEGVKDAFVIAIYNGKRITLKEAKDLSNK